MYIVQTLTNMYTITETTLKSNRFKKEPCGETYTYKLEVGEISVETQTEFEGFLPLEINGSKLPHVKTPKDLRNFVNVLGI